MYCPEDFDVISFKHSRMSNLCLGLKVIKYISLHAIVAELKNGHLELMIELKYTHIHIYIYTYIHTYNSYIQQYNHTS